MTSQRKQKSNRRNSRSSTGPRTLLGKSKSRLNATTHRLSIPISNTREFKAVLERLTRALLNDVTDMNRSDLAQRAAASHLELERIRKRRAELVDLAALDPYAYKEFGPPEFRNPDAESIPSFSQQLNSEDFLVIAAHEYRFPSLPGNFAAEILGYMRAIKVLKSVERYEAREFAKRNLALRRLFEQPGDGTKMHT